MKALDSLAHQSRQTLSAKTQLQTIDFIQEEISAVAIRMARGKTAKAITVDKR